MPIRIRKRVLVLLIALTLLFGVLGVRVGKLTTVDSVALTQRGVRQWTRDGIVYARRGRILDAKGDTLVLSTTAFIVSANPRKVADVDAFTGLICPILDVDADAAAKKLADRTKASVVLKRQVSRETVDQLRQLPSADAKALVFDEDVRRMYPRGSFLTQALGLTNVDSVGQSGLEQTYETLLRGTAGRSLTSVDARNRTLYDSENLYIEPQEGCTLKLTIDSAIQDVVEKAMRECLAVNKAKNVQCIVMDTATGAILAMCVKPDYDPNAPPRDDVDTLRELMRIRLISDAYEPGSTFKVLTAAAALDSGVTTPDDHFYCSAKIKVDGDTIRCWGSPHKAETMAEGLQNSCNPVFVELALRMGQERLYGYLQSFGLGKQTQVDLLGEESGILIPAKSVKNVDLARIGFGQSVAVTPIQLLTAACSVINGGRLMRPYLLQETLSAEGEVLYRAQPKVVSTPISEETSATMRELLEKVVSDGGARNAKIDGYRIGGKTGTAQVYKEGRIVRDVHIGSFLGFAPADQPRIALLVIVDEADMPVDYGGTTAAPFARQIFADVLPYLGYQPFAEEAEQVAVPSVVGQELWQARKALTAAGFKVIDDGGEGLVTAQMPAAGAKLAQGGQAMLYTDAALTRDDTLVCVPDLKGLSIVDAGRLLRQRGLEMRIEGSGFAVGQSPAAGEYLTEGMTVDAIFAMPQ